MFYADQAIGQLLKQLASVMARKCGHG